MNGIMYCSGPRLEKEAEKYIDEPGIHVAVNLAPKRMYFPETAYYICEKNHRFYDEMLDRPDLIMVNWVKKHDMDMSPTSFPNLVCMPDTCWTALHFLMTMGCMNIHAVGMNFEVFPNGGYSLYTTEPGFNIMADQKHRFLLEVIPNLKKYKISFTSEALSFHWEDPFPYPVCEVT